MPEKKIYTANGHRITKEEIEWVCEEHQLGRLVKVIGSPKSGNVNGIIFIHTVKGKFAIRFISFTTTKERIDYLESVLKALNKGGVPVLRAVKTKHLDYFSITNDQYIQVYPYVSGYKFMYIKQQIEANARMLSQLHQTLATHEQGPLPDLYIYPNLNNLTNKLQILEENNKLIANQTLSRIKFLYTAIEKQWNYYEPTYLPKTIIHDDWHPWNMIYKANGSIAAIFDYDYMQQGERIYDVAYALYYLNKRSKATNFKQLQLFLSSYGDLNETEKTILPLVIAKVALFNILFSTNSKSEEKINRTLDVNEELIIRLLHKGLQFR